MTTTLTLEEWEARIKALAEDMTDVRFQIGDWFNVGLATFSTKDIHAIAEEVGWSKSTVKVYSWVAAGFAPEHRIYKVPFMHYQIVVSLPEPLRYELLMRAERENLSWREVRAAVREIKQLPPLQSYRNDYVVEVGCDTPEMAERVCACIEAAGWDVAVRMRLRAESRGLQV